MVDRFSSFFLYDFGHREWFKDYEKVHKGLALRIKYKDGRVKWILDVRYALDLTHNFLLVSQLVDVIIDTIFTKGCKLVHGSILLAMRTRLKTLYKLEMTILVMGNANLTSMENRNPMEATKIQVWCCSIEGTC